MAACMRVCGSETEAACEVLALLSTPAELKVGDAIQSHFLRRRRPEFLAVTNANTGTRMGAGPLRRKAATLRMKVLGKLGGTTAGGHGVAVAPSGDVYIAQLSGVVQKFVKQ